MPKALEALAESLVGSKRARYGSTRSADARYVLDVVLDRITAEPGAAGDAPARKLTPQEAMTELRKRLGGSNV